jgi:hypothetical protein
MEDALRNRIITRTPIAKNTTEDAVSFSNGKFEGKKRFMNP